MPPGFGVDAASRAFEAQKRSNRVRGKWASSFRFPGPAGAWWTLATHRGTAERNLLKE
jgi:hypothetical protein